MTRKRGNGEGTIYKRPDGRYCAQESIDGKRITAYGKNKTEALSKLKKKIKERLVSGEMRPDKKNITISEYIPYFVHSIPLTNESTKEHYGVIGKRIQRLIGDIRMNQVSDTTVDELASKLQKNGYASATIHTTMAFYTRILRNAQKEGYIPNRITISENKKRRAKKVYELPDLSDTIRALKEIQPIGMRYIGLFCLYTGLRRGELIGLKWKDIDLEQGIISVKRNYTVTAVTHRLTPKAPKNGIRAQRVQIPKEGLALLKELKDEYNAKSINSEFVFCNKKGEHLRPDSVTATLHRAMAKVSSHGSVHILRHLYATVLAKNGVPLRTISKQLRHSSIATTDIYINSIQDEYYDELEDISIGGCSTVAVEKSKNQS